MKYAILFLSSLLLFASLMLMLWIIAKWDEFEERLDFSEYVEELEPFTEPAEVPEPPSEMSFALMYLLIADGAEESFHDRLYWQSRAMELVYHAGGGENA